jgi:ketosteroid isomerase-like protein
MVRSEFEQFLRDFYQARLSNDVDRCMPFFTARSRFRLAGSTNTSVIARSSESLEGIRDQVSELIRVWAWQKIEFYNLVFDGDTAAARYLLTTIFNPSGEAIATEIVDVLKVCEGKVIEFHQFVDTAAVEKIVARHNLGPSAVK